MKKINLAMVYILVAMMLASCTTMGAGEANTKNPQADYTPISERAEFIDAKEAAEFLAKDDDFMQNISFTDIQARFKTDFLPNEGQRVEYYNKATKNWTESDKEKVLTALNSLSEKTSDLNLNLPQKIKFIKSDGSEEGGAAAYTRGEYIVLTETVFNEGLQFTNYIIAHEFFHIYSRYNYNDKPKFYEIINFTECENLMYPDEIKDLKLTNPDAPLNNFYIECEYNGEKLNFIPIIYREKPFDINVDTNMFVSMRDPMLAVEIINGKPEAIYRDGKAFIVEKTELSDFYTKIGKNTNYTIHPEEILAENFAQYITDLPLNSPWVVEELLEVMKND